MKTTDKSPPNSPQQQAKSCNSCDGCKYQHFEVDSGWCYMFKDRPENLPCAQHDKFEEKRKEMSSVVRNHPQILALMIMGMSH